MSVVEIVPLFAIALLGAGLGFFGGLFGIGGGIIVIPVLTMGFGLDQASAQGTALVMMVPNLLIAWWRYVRHNPGAIKGAAGVALVGTLTTWGTAQLAQRLDQGLLRGLFALFLVFLAVRMITKRDASAALGQPKRDLRLLPLVGVVGGTSMGLLGVGGGLVATPLFTGLFGLGQRSAQSLGLALVAPSSVIALTAYAQHQKVDWSLGLPLAAGGLFTVAAGVSLAHRWSERKLQHIFGWMLAATGLWLLIGRFVV